MRQVSCTSSNVKHTLGIKPTDDTDITFVQV